jgi:hypothetical protein
MSEASLKESLISTKKKLLEEKASITTNIDKLKDHNKTVSLEITAQIKSLEFKIQENNKFINEAIKLETQKINTLNDEIKVVNNDLAAITQKELEKQKRFEAQEAILDKIKYVQRCWDYMVNRQIKKDNIFQGKLEDCKEYDWDTIIAKAHISHFNGLFRKRYRDLIGDPDYATLDDLIHLLKKEEKKISQVL